MSIPEQEGSPEPRSNDEVSEATPSEEVASSHVPSTRISRLWVRSLPALIALVVVLILVAQNRSQVTVRFFAGTLRTPLAVALLGAMVLGALMMLGLGSLRVLQLRRRIRRQGRSR